MEALISPAINVGMLIGILVYYLRSPLKEFVKSRHVLVANELKQVRQQAAEAHKQYEEFGAKLKTVSEEVAALKKRVNEEAAGIRGRMIVHSKQISGTIIADARSAAQAAVVEMKNQMCTEMGHKVVDQAEKMISSRLTHDDRSWLRKEFSEQLEHIQ